MLRGSKPGERRGGRDRGTPNRRSILRDRILAIGLDYPTATQPAFLLKLIDDRKLPPDTRLAIGLKCFPPKRRRGAQSAAAVPASPEWTPQALGAFFGVVQDATADPKVRKKAAQKIAEFLLPKTAKKPKVDPDEYGFLISPRLADTYRDTNIQLANLRRGRNIPAIAQRLKKVEARCAALLERVAVPSATTYGDKEADDDLNRVAELSGKKTLTEAEQAEQAHRWTRWAVFYGRPEAVARRRRLVLALAKRQGRLLSAEEQKELEVLQQRPDPEPTLAQLERERFEMPHPFWNEVPDQDGSYYPLHALLKEAGAGDERKWLVQLREMNLTVSQDTGDQRNSQLRSRSRLRDLEQRRAGGYELTASEEREVGELRNDDPEYAAIIDLLDLPYLSEWAREVKKVKRAGLTTFAACEQADIVGLRLRDQTKFTTEADAKEYRRQHRGKPAEAAPLEPQDYADIRLLDDA